jgi:hypothetical protein
MSDKINTLQNIINEFESRVNTLKQNMLNDFKSVINDVFSEVFNAHPEIEKIAWTQYTPYFNDGESCIFNVHDVYFLRTDDTQELKESHIYEWHSAGWGDDVKNFPALKKLNALITSSEDILLMMFGDHCQITVTRDGIDVEEHEHD